MPTRRIDAQAEQLRARVAGQVEPGRGRAVFNVTHRRHVDRAHPVQSYAWSVISGSVQH
jgi:hypothetical protein